MKKVLIANRGEIAMRLIRACRDCGLASVAVYADPDADAPYVRAADAAFALPGSRPADTYLNIPALLQIAARAGADALHPGYGFLSESAAFAAEVQAAGLIWIGPAPAVIARLGDKIAARALAASVGAPLVPGSQGPVASASEAQSFAETFGLPIAIKAVYGGGGRGMRVARRHDEIAELFAAAEREAKAAFGNDACYVERFLERPRHVEAQVIADRFGKVLVLGTRDCSLQRRNQKLIEEAPAPFLTEQQRQRIETSAADICRAAGYCGVGTVEFLLAQDGTLAFLEVNTRLQVEHPVTEELFGIDLVAEQFRIAQGLPLSLEEVPAPRGHAIEFRINAEDPGRGFLPTPGRISLFAPPSGPGVRLDSGVETGSVVAASFDSLMAKLIITAPSREQALARARRALAEFQIEGPAHVLAFHRAVLQAADFTDAAAFAVHTGWIETDFAQPLQAALRVEPIAPVVLRGPIEIDGQRHDIGIGADLLARLAQSLGRVGAPAADQPAAQITAQMPATAADQVTAALAGSLLKWLVQDGAMVMADQPIAVIEAMKMESQVLAPRAGRLTQTAPAGADLQAGAGLGRIEPAA